MMYRKAILFDDLEIAQEILAAKTAKAQKALERKVKGFTDKVWYANKENIVEEGNVYKFLNPKNGSEDWKRNYWRREIGSSSR